MFRKNSAVPVARLWCGKTTSMVAASTTRSGRSTREMAAIRGECCVCLPRQATVPTENTAYIWNVREMQFGHFDIWTSPE